MADTCAVYTVAGMTMNASTGDTVILETVDGLDSVPLRRTRWPQGQSDGEILGTAKKQARLPVFTGFVLIRSAHPFKQPAAFESATEALEAAWRSAIDGLENSDGTLAWLSHSLTVRKDGGVKFSPGPNGVIGKKFYLSLIAANPTIS